MSLQNGDRLSAAAPALLETLFAVAGFVNHYIDVVDGPDGTPQANDAMLLMREIEEVIFKATGSYP